MAPFGLDLGFLIEEYAGGKGVYPVKKRRKKNSIYICTIEKALGVVNNLIELNRFDEVKESFPDSIYIFFFHELATYFLILYCHLLDNFDYTFLDWNYSC